MSIKKAFWFNLILVDSLATLIVRKLMGQNLRHQTIKGFLLVKRIEKNVIRHNCLLMLIILIGSYFKF